MTGSVLGTLICLERIIGNKNKWWRLLPLINGLSAVMFVANQPIPGYTLLIFGSVGLLILMLTYCRNSATLSNWMLALGAFAWLTGNLVLLQHNSYPLAVKWWMLFFLWTIFGERLELSRMLPVSVLKKYSLFFILILNMAGVLLPFHWYGNEFFSISFIALSIWLFFFDMSRQAFRFPYHHRYIALWLMTGYGWLLISGSWLLFRASTPFGYDAALHSFFIGFVFSVVFGHVPIIFPGIFKINISLYHRSLYFVYVLFQLALLGRIIGDALADNHMRKWGAMMNGISILLFIAFTVAIIITRSKQKRVAYVLPKR
jgi:hypothetical protein